MPPQQQEIQFVDLRDDEREQKKNRLTEACGELSSRECLVVVNEYDLEPLFDGAEDILRGQYSIERFQVEMDVCIGIIHRETENSGRNSVELDDEDYSQIFSGLPMDTGKSTL